MTGEFEKADGQLGAPATGRVGEEFGARFEGCAVGSRTRGRFTRSPHYKHILTFAQNNLVDRTSTGGVRRR